MEMLFEDLESFLLITCY